MTNMKYYDEFCKIYGQTVGRRKKEYRYCDVVNALRNKGSNISERSVHRYMNALIDQCKVRRTTINGQKYYVNR